MRALIYRSFGEVPRLEALPDPEPAAGGVVIRVEATGLCRSDWHGWMGHDKDITLPHVPGHELAGVVVAVGEGVRNWRGGERVTLPFVCGCGHCSQCASGNPQVCDRQFQPGFTAWGSFAELVAVEYADHNLVALPEEMDFATAAVLGCRFITAYRAIAEQGRLQENQWLAVHGCGGVGLSAVMIGRALGARVAAVDIRGGPLRRAGSLGAELLLNAGDGADVAAAIRDACDGGAHVSIDALGSPATCFSSIQCLRKRGRHVQVGLIGSDDGSAVVPLSRIIADELELFGSHGMAADRYAEVFSLIAEKKLSPERLIGRRIALSDAASALAGMNHFDGEGVTIIDPGAG